MVISRSFYGLKQILTANSLHSFQQRHIWNVLEENLGRLTLIVEKQHLNYFSVGIISLHNLGTFVTFVELT